MLRLTLILFSLHLFTVSYPQSPPIEPTKKLSILSLTAASTAFPVGVSYSQQINDRQMFEVGVGLAYILFPERPGFGVAFKHHFREIKSKPFNTYSGLLVGDIWSPLDTPGPFITVPIGANYATKHVFLDASIGPTTLPNESWIIAFYGGLSVGIYLNSSGS